MPHFIVFMLNSFLLALVLTQGLSVIAPRLGLLDAPHGRKMHECPVPVTGGLAMFGAFGLSAAQLDPSLQPSWALLAGISLLVVIGTIDDMRALGPWQKLGGQIAAVLVLILPGGHLIETCPLLAAGCGELPQMELALTLTFVVGTINAFNMFDGLDGLAGGTAAVALAWLAVAAALSGLTATLVQLVLIACAVLGFLVFNLRHPWRRRAAAYMGDAGSMMLGAVVAFFAVVLSAGPKPAVPLPALLWFFALPVSDMLIVIMRRLTSGSSPLRGDRLHLHHFLLRAGIAPQTAAAMLILACLVLGAVGLTGWQLGAPDQLILLGLVAPLLLHAYVVLHGWKIVARHLVARSAQAAGAPDAVHASGN